MIEYCCVQLLIWISWLLSLFAGLLEMNGQTDNAPVKQFIKDYDSEYIRMAKTGGHAGKLLQINISRNSFMLFYLCFLFYLKKSSNDNYY